MTALVLQNYSVQNADLLRQPALLDHFEKRLAEMSADIRSNPMMTRMRDGMQKVRPLIASTDARISQNQVKEISAISQDLLKAVSR